MSLLGAFREAIRALKPYGAAPIVVVTLACAGMVGLTRGADPFAVIALVLLSFGFFYLTQERRAEWRRKDQEVEYEALERKDAMAVRRRLDRRLQRTRNANQPTLFGDEEPVGARDD